MKKTNNSKNIKVLLNLPKPFHTEIKIGAINDDSKLYEYIIKCIEIGHKQISKNHK